ncbi:MAG: COX15/CtaA family protein [Planctomycetes bacterium]|nr:COX15/CtaA family protein [Planctomycetota bacterium]
MKSFHSAWLHRFAVATAAATVILLFLGGLVTSTASGDAVPDWWFVPISYGTLLPPMVGGILFEHGHRLAATTVGIFTIVLAVWLWRCEPRSWLRQMGLLALAAIVLQGILGGLRVRLGGSDPSLRPVLAIVHACVAQAFFCLTVAIALFTSKSWAAGSGPSARPSRLFWLAAASAAVLFIQLILGALMRHTGSGLFVHVQVAGLASVLVIATALWAHAAHGDDPGLSRPASVLVGLLLLQVALGVATYAILSQGFERSVHARVLHLGVITGHLVTGAMLLGASVVLALKAYSLLPGPAAGRALPLPAMPARVLS